MVIFSRIFSCRAARRKHHAVTHLMSRRNNLRRNAQCTLASASSVTRGVYCVSVIVNNHAVAIVLRNDRYDAQMQGKLFSDDRSRRANDDVDNLRAMTAHTSALSSPASNLYHA